MLSLSEENRNPWDSIKEQLRKRLSSESFENWIKRTKFAGLEGKSLLVTVPDRHTIALIADEYGRQIDTLAATLGFDRVQFMAEVANSTPGMPGSQTESE